MIRRPTSFALAAVFALSTGTAMAKDAPHVEPPYPYEDPNANLHYTACSMPYYPPRGLGSSAAPQRLMFDQIVDLDFLGASHKQGVDGKDLSFRLEVQGAGKLRLGPLTTPQPFGELGARAVVGMKLNKDRWLRISSEVLGESPLPTEDNPVGLSGRHLAQARFGFGEADEGELGLEVTGEAQLDHGEDSGLLMRPEVGAGAFWDRRAEAGVGLRRGIDDGVVWVWPIEVGFREVGHPDRPGEGFVRQSVSTGLGVRPLDRDALDGTLDLVDVTWSRTEFKRARTDCPEGLDCAIPAGLGLFEDRGPAGGLVLDQMDLRVFSVDDVGGYADDELLFSVGLDLGGSWMWEGQTGRNAATPTIGARTSMQFFNDEHVIRIGLATDRRATHSADGARFLADHRIEFEGGYEDTDLGISIRHRTAIALANDLKDEDKKDAPVAESYGMHTEWAYHFSDLQLGAWHRAHLGPEPTQPAGDIFEMERRWEHELGLFVRYGLGTDD